MTDENKEVKISVGNINEVESHVFVDLKSWSILKFNIL